MNREVRIKCLNKILGAFVNNELQQLSFEVFHPKTVEFIDITNADGMRIYIRSLSFLLYYAIKKIMPEATLRIEHSVSKGVYCELKNVDNLDVIDVENIANYMRKIVKQDLPFVYKEDETPKVISLFKENNFEAKAGLLEQLGHNYSSYYYLNDQVASFYGFLVPSTGYLEVFDVYKYYNGLLLQIPKRFEPEKLENLIIQNKMFEIFREYSSWNEILKISNINNLNSLKENNEYERLIKVSEALHEKKIAHIADMIVSRKDEISIILISGPSSSGKTTFSKRLAIQLMVVGLKPKNLSLDNYFVNRINTPVDENGEYDFEALEALDLDFFNNQLNCLLNGEEVEIPKFSFETGERYFDNTMVSLQKGDVLVIEGIHALNPKLTKLVSDNYKFKIYVSALTSINIDNHNRIPTTDNRLVRRIVRDYKYRNYSAEETLSRWQSVRRGENKHIFPYQEEADVMFNTALPFEFAVLKHYIEPILLEVKPNSKEFSEAKRLLKFLNYFKAFDDKTIPPTSIIREFLGGSSFNY